MSYAPFRFWQKFKECEIQRAGKMPFFCLSMLYTQDVIDSEYDSEPIPDKTVWKAYWYCMN